MIDEYDTGENLMRHLKHTLAVGQKVRDSLPVIDKSIYKQGLRATLFGRKQTGSSRILFLTFAGALSWRHMKDQIKI